MSKIDFEFVLEIYAKYTKHLNGAIESIEKAMVNYDKEIEGVNQALNFKPNEQDYHFRLKQLRDKKFEADKKLSFMVPRRNKMMEQMIIISEEKGLQLLKLAKE